MLNAWIAGVIAVAASLLAAALLPRRWRRGLCVAFARLAARYPAGSLAAIAALPVAARLCCLPFFPRPTPIIPDEYSYLLLARTFAAGHLANPQHPLWPHFETLFVLQQPTYASVYPAVQGIMLAAGLVLFAEPWAGVLAGIAVMSAAVVWMLRAYVSRGWALYGGLLAAVGFGILNYWANSYWGGAGAAIGGALAFGALPRMLWGARRRDAALLGLGLVVLANSRPYEGFLAALPAAFWLLRRSVRPAADRGAALLRQAPVLASVLLTGAALTGWYNWRVTGSPFRLPHTAYIRQYAAAPAFVWQRPQTAPAYRDRVLRDAHISFGVDFSEYATLPSAAAKTLRKLTRLAGFYWGPWWALALLAVPEFLRERRFRAAGFSLLFCVGGILLTVGFQVHYAAPCASIFILMLVDAFRRFYRDLKTAGSLLVIAAPLAWIGSEVLTPRTPPVPASLAMRHSFENAVAAGPARHLVVVHYSPWHPLGEEWVYNDPDIDRSRIVWARDLGPQANRELALHFPDRQLWLAEPDRAVPRITPCGRGKCPLPSDGEAPSI